MKLRKNHLISPKNFAISSGENQKYLPRYFENSSGEIEMSLLSLYYYNASALMATQPLVDKKTTTRIAPRGRQMLSFAS